MNKLQLNISNDFNERVTLFADVLLPVPIPQNFTYRVPFEHNDHIGIGYRVIVQFGRKKILTGIVVQLHNSPPENYQAKYIIDILDNHPVLNEKQISFFRWMASYYMCTPGEVLNVGMPSGLKLSSESKIQLNPAFDTGTIMFDFTNKEKMLLQVLEREKILTYGQAAQILQIKTYLKVIKSLLAKEAILLFEEVKEKYSPKKESRIRLQEQWLDQPALEELMASLDKRPAQQNVLLAYLQHVPIFNDPALNTTGMSKKALLAHEVSASSIATLTKNHVLEQFDVIVPRVQLPEAQEEAIPQLTAPQQKAYQDILQQFEKHHTVLLHGITGSGKTEIYVELIRNVIAQGEQVLYLLPEIALTTQIVSRLQKVFGSAMGVYHSKYADNERVEVWRGLLSGRFSIIVGVRSSIFLPFDNLGLVIVDEEHEYSYKQYDPAPRYHARDAVQVLAQRHAAKVLLGTATPSFESFYLAREGKYGYIQLNQRYGEAQLPKISFADLTQERREKTIKGDFTSALTDKIAGALSRNEQVIVFQNRRGYSPYVTCEQCSWIPKCNNCDVSLTYHMHYNQLRCHYCGHHERLPVICPACGSSNIKTVGFGTEKLEDDLKILFPQARIQRMDLDTTRRKYSYQKIIGEFEQGDIDILIGTQMVSKGLDFGGVTLVGIFDIDRMLHFPDFRASERAYQLAVQVSGRSGRNTKPGEVVIQTANLKQPVLHYILYQDFTSFYEHELEERHKYKYPPFYRIIRITLKHKDKGLLQQAAVFYTEKIKKLFHPKLVLGPHEPMVGKIRNYYLMEVLIKMNREKTDLVKMKNFLKNASISMKQTKNFKQVFISFDVDPF